MAKPLLADGSESSHALALVHDAAGVVALAAGGAPGVRPPCVLQQFVDHGGSIFKVYVVGAAVSVTRRRSLPNQVARTASAPAHAASLLPLPCDDTPPPPPLLPLPPLPPPPHHHQQQHHQQPTRSLSLSRPGSASGVEPLERISTLGLHWQRSASVDKCLDAPSSAPPGLFDASSPPGYIVEGADAVTEPCRPFVEALAAQLQAALRLQLFNFDLIRVAAARDTFLVVDINYFPGLSKMPGYEGVFADFLSASAAAARQARAKAASSAAAEGGDAGGAAAGAPRSQAWAKPAPIAAVEHAVA